MKTINLDAEILSFDEQPIPDRQKGSNVTLKDMLLTYLGLFESNDGAQLIEASVLAHRIFKAENNVELSKEEMKLVQECIKTPRHVAVAYASMMDFLELQ